jgi:release factor glutamine methyltransferase
VHQRLVRDAIGFLRPGGWLLFEMGVGQERQIKLLFDRAKT